MNLDGLQFRIIAPNRTILELKHKTGEFISGFRPLQIAPYWN